MAFPATLEKRYQGHPRVKFLCEQCKAKYQIADDKVVGKTVRMKCRKCGHLIEVRAAVADTSLSSVPPAEAPAAGGSPGQPKAPQKPLPPRATSVAANLASKAPAPKPDRLPGALAGTFKTAVQHEDEISAPFDMSELAPGDDWYVAVNGVPVGPIRIAEIRRKAALGAVTEDSLVWQEGLDEWRPLRSFPELASTVREAASAGRTSITPPPADARPSAIPAPRSISGRPAPVGPRAAQPRFAPIPAATAPRSNVVPITSRLATAERLEEPPFSMKASALPSVLPDASPFTAAAVVDPFQPASASPAATVPSVSTAAPEVNLTPKGPPWILIAMFAMAIAFGITAAIVIFVRPPASAAPPVVVQVPVAAALPPPTTTTSAASGANDTPAPLESAPSHAAKSAGTATTGARSAGSPSPSAGGRSLDLHGLAGGLTIAPTDDVNGEGPKAAGQCLSEGQVAQVIGQHQAGIRRTCWERNQSAKGSVNVKVSLSIGPDGNPQSVSTEGEDLSVAHCIETDVRTWHFPPMGCSQKIMVPFKFVRQ
jgi:predicted Zn finger-like uncharacterized protein